MTRYIEVNALMEYCSNQKSKTISNNDIARFPIADVVDVVRCKDCKHQDYCYKTVSYTKVRLGYNEHGAKPIEWCSNGERRE